MNYPFNIIILKSSLTCASINILPHPFGVYSFLKIEHLQCRMIMG